MNSSEIRPPAQTKPGHRVGLLGGSFNPAHEAHLEISLAAMKRLKLDQIWWLVSPQNPLKSTDQTAPLSERIEQAKSIATSSDIYVSDLENRLGTQFTIDTLKKLISLFPEVHFVWLMGADNVHQFHRWKDWRQIFCSIPVAVFSRPGHMEDLVETPAAKEFSSNRLDEADAAQLLTHTLPAWTIITDCMNPLSSTEIRNKTAR